MTIRRVATMNVLFVILGLFGCGGASSITPVQPPPIVLPDVYVAGYELNAAGNDVAMVWKNGVGLALTNGNFGAYATSVTVSGSDVYVAGVESNGSATVAMVWKNGSATALTDGTLEAAANQIIVSGSDVYVAGGQYGFDNNTQFVDEVGYWKNGVFTTLVKSDSQGQGGGQAAAIAIEGQDVYVAGTQSITTQTGPGTAVENSVPTYWKNGAPTTLTSGLYSATVTSLSVAGTDVYVAGAACSASVPNCYTATYWKNGAPVTLSQASPGVLSGIAVSGTTVYASGNLPSSGGSGVSANYWTGDDLTILSQSSAAAANNVVTFGDDVYVVGAEPGGACYWKDGVPQPVSDGLYTSTGYAIAVVQPPS
jgi:hypothetical protein